MRTVRKRTTSSVFTDPAIFKAYDIRGIVPQQINSEIAYSIGRVFPEIVEGVHIAVGRDARLSSDELAGRLIDGLAETGCVVEDLGCISTDALYFAVGKHEFDGGIMVTASHNPAEYNGFKLCRRNAEPLSGTDGIDVLRDALESNDMPPKAPGERRQRDIMPEFIDHALSFVDVSTIKRFKIAIDAANGVAGVFLPRLLERLPVEVIPLYFEPDGNFPNHPADPINADNLVDLQKAIKTEKADFGVAFDGDADRMFLLDENGRPLGGDIVTALVAKNMLAKHPGDAVLYNLICSKCVPETIVNTGGRPVRTPVGHALIKPIMKEHDAVFGGEHSGHFYFRDNWFADSGAIAMIICMELLSQSDKPLSELVAEIDPYHRSGEINSEVTDTKRTLNKIIKAYHDARPDTTDGLTIELDGWWFNVRPSNTEPLLRLNVEAESADVLEEKTAEVLALIRPKSRARKSRAKAAPKETAAAATAEPAG